MYAFLLWQPLQLVKVQLKEVVLFAAGISRLQQPPSWVIMQSMTSPSSNSNCSSRQTGGKTIV
jgi:hypothetical protein